VRAPFSVRFAHDTRVRCALLTQMSRECGCAHEIRAESCVIAGKFAHPARKERTPQDVTFGPSVKVFLKPLRLVLHRMSRFTRHLSRMTRRTTNSFSICRLHRSLIFHFSPHVSCQCVNRGTDMLMLCDTWKIIFYVTSAWSFFHGTRICPTNGNQFER
jgi:hypothetical protein